MAAVRWHINGSGVAGRCKAQPGECPIAPNAPYFETAADARAAYEESMAEDAVAPSTQRAPKPMSSGEEAERRVVRRTPEPQPSPSAGGHGHGAALASSIATARRRRSAAVATPSSYSGHGLRATPGHGRPATPTPSYGHDGHGR